MTDYYVAPAANGGSNSNNGLSTLTPWLTLAFAQSNTSSSDRIFHLSGGVWNDQTYSFSTPRTLDVYNGSSRWVMDYDGSDGGDYHAMITLTGSNSSVNSVEIRNQLSGNTSADGGRGIASTGNNITVDDCYFHNIGSTAVIRDGGGEPITVTNSVFEEINELWFSDTGSTWGAAVSAAGTGNPIDGLTVQNCTIFENVGEGFTAYSASTTTPATDVLVEDCDICADRSAGIYLNGVHDGIVRRNMVLGTTDTDYHRVTGFVGYGIAQDVEADFVSASYSCDNNHFYLNLCAYTSPGFYSSNGFGSALTNNEVWHNTFIDCEVSMHFGGGTPGSGNIFRQNASIPISGSAAHDNGTHIITTNWTRGENFWSGGGEDAAFNHASDFSDSAWTPSKASGWQAINGLNDVTVADFRPDTQVLGTQYTNPDTGANWTDYEGSTNFREAGALTLAVAAAGASPFQHTQNTDRCFGPHRSQRLGGEIEE